MKLSKTVEKKIMLVYNAYWDNYLRGDVEAMQPLLDKDYTQVGSAENEVFANKKEAVKFLYDTISQVAGKLQMRNRLIKPCQQDTAILVHENCDLFALADDEWIFYSKFRASTFLQEKKDGWKITHQHSSFPDVRTGEGQNVAIDKIAEENLQLREAVKRRTLELEQKNRDLEIETALEKVRATALGMNKPDDLPGICEILFSALKTLGFAEIRNAMINIHDDGTGSLINYDYSDEIGTSINHLSYTIHPLIEKQIKQIRSAGDAFSETSFKGKDLKDWKAFRKKIGEKDDPRIEKTKALYYYFYSIGTGSIGISTFSPITEEKLHVLKRFRNVFDFAYRRYIDVAKAEAQSREAQIELALERVRARTMAMQKSDELAETAVLLFQQLRSLGLDLRGCGFNIWEKDEKTCTAWMSGPEGTLGLPFNLPLTEIPFFIRYAESKKNGEDFWVHETRKEELAARYQYLRTLPDLGKVLADEQKDGTEPELPPFVVDHVVNFSNGNLIFITYKQYPEAWDIFKRFAKVFEQTYTRFLDLQKAEAQAKESQIQLALERVRARTMAMQRSDELAEVSSLLFQQLKSLGVDSYSSGFTTWDTDNNYLISWMCNADGSMNPPFTMPIAGDAWHIRQYESWKNGKDFILNDMTGELMQSYFRYLRSFPLLDAAFQKSIAAGHPMPERQVHNVANFSQGNLLFITLEPCAEAHDIFKRFAKVFDQTYTRFLDLQKAEAQARQARIEVAMEKVRSSAMAMQKPNELVGVAELLRKEMGLLGVEELETSSIYIHHEDTGKTECWYAIQKDNKLVSDHMTIDLNDTRVGKEMLAFYGSGKRQTSILMQGEARKEWINYCAANSNELIGFYGGNIPDRIYHLYKFTNGYIGAASPGDISAESRDLLQRATSVFSLAYTRFSDLQQAEAQAREAKIEAALERVRSRTMGMQKSEELKEIIKVVYEQFVYLNIRVEHAGFIMDYKAQDDMNIWLADQHYIPSQITIPYFDSPHWNSFSEAKERGLDFFANYLGFEEKNKFYQDLFKFFPVTDDTKEYYFSCPGLAISTVLLENIGLYIENFSGSPYTDQENATLMRFGKVFQQTYTRFLDLQKAEVQAREAQIETALEKVRSRSLAVHKSHEFKEVIKVVFERLQELAIPMTSASINIFIEGSKDTEVYICGPGDDGLVLSHFRLVHFDHPISNGRFEAYEKGMDFFTQTYGAEEKNGFYEFEFEVSGLKHLPDEVKKLVMESERYTMSLALAKHSMIVVNDFEGKSLSAKEIDIIKRFAKVFEQAYTRFLDLQKAEEQAKEAKIEAALERVRSSSLAMHRSDELQGVVNTVIEQLKELNIEFDTSNILIFNDELKSIEFWTGSNSTGKQLTSSWHASYTDDIVLKEIFQAQQNGEEVFLKYLSFEEKNRFFDYLFTNTDFKNLNAERKKFIFESGRATILGALVKEVAIQTISYSREAFLPDEIEILKRFAKVFEQAYTRFLDLQKAEAQTREAKIEAALERTRTQSMIMQHSKELDDTLRVFHEQVLLLGIPSAFSFLWLPDEENDRHIFWAAWKENLAAGQARRNDSTVFKSKAITYPLDRKEPATAQCLVDWKGTERIVSYHVPPPGVESYFAAWQELIDGVEQLKPEHFSGGLYYVEAFMKYGCFGIMVTTDLAEGEKKLLSRFAIEFERTYTRFLDLQKAEIQAREANIEASLERVRAKAMAMHHSDELDEVLAVLFDQFDTLGIESVSTHMTLIDLESNTFTFRETGKAGHRSYGEQTVAIDSMDIWKDAAEKWRTSEPLSVNRLHFPKESLPVVWQIFHESFASMPDDAKIVPEDYPDGIYHTAGNCKFGYIGMNQTRKATEEEEQIVLKFATEFGRLYQRFLDLKKAEAQAREAQIELGLERVRARAMAMQNSDELKELIATVFIELTKLDFVLTRCLIIIFDSQSNASTWWMANSEAPSDPIGLYVKGHQLPPYAGYIKAWKEQKNKWQYILEGEDKEEWDKFLFTETGLSRLPDFVIAGMKAPDRVCLSASFNNFGCLNLATLEPLPVEHFDILLRFAKVFDLTYTRFNDLQKAEAQAKEAQIETGLERVRSRSLAMHHTSELQEVIHTVHKELLNLNIAINGGSFIAINSDIDTTLRCWGSGGTADTSAEVHLPLYEKPFCTNLINKIKTGPGFFTEEYTQEEKREFFTFLFKYEPWSKLDAKQKKETLSSTGGYTRSCCVSLHTSIFIINHFGEKFSVADNEILKRFGKIFEQAYTRFLDLQKAEGQAKEAQIEAALEKVRSRTMAMQRSDELAGTAALLFREFKKLTNQDLIQTTIGIYDETKNEIEFRATDWEGRGEKVDRPAYGSMDEPTLLKPAVNAWKAKERSLVVELTGEELEGWVDYRNRMTGVSFSGKDAGSKRIISFAFFSKGHLSLSSPLPLSDETVKILERFAAVFDGTYTRFLDLQKAEAQAREATIEAALEKVRGKAMAMNDSKDLSSTIVLAFAELKKLGIEPLRFGVGLINKELHKAQLYSATSSADGDGVALIGWILFKGHPVIENIYDYWIKNEDYFPVLEGEQLKSYYELLSSGLTIPKAAALQSGEKQYGHFFPLPVSCLYAWAEQPFNETDIKILKRFSAIVELTFRRYMELQKSETNARETIKQSALDRIRADIASMRTTADLERITPVIWNELTILGIPFIRCGVFLMDDAQQLIHTFLSTPDGKAIAAFHLPYTAPGNIAQILNHWKDKKNYIDHWNEEVFRDFAETLVQQGALNSPEQYLKTLPSGGFYLHFLPFLQGMLYVGNTTKLGDEELKIIQSVADAFSTAYARYEDFNKLELAKKRVDSTLDELQAAQKQLIQSEKMASLGELTAGIAHEIQNPLNFVNNFSEVSTELLDEMITELENDNKEDAIAIADDVKQNLEKILHHGKRADGIVKGMLQHSRSSSATKEPTDINKLADEYLRLAYHGLRAKDKSFNATLKTDYDESIGNIDIIPQDIGRVILNLITNAFYAASLPSKEGLSGADDRHDPIVWVSTKKIRDKVLISVKDNGPGIPQKILDKIFQPFFTTKPTGQGTGLGLSLSYDIVKAHAGELKVETKEGEGSIFTILLNI